jgi:hypothetical protein
MVLLLFVGSGGAAPTATGAQYSLLEGTYAEFVPWVNDPVFSDTFTFHILTQPSNGTPSYTDSTHTMLEYTPFASFTQGTDSFTFRVIDQDGKKAHGTAHIRVYNSTDYTICTRLGTVFPHTDPVTHQTVNWIGVRTKSNNCTFYSSRQTRVLPDVNKTPVTMDYFINWPSSPTPPTSYTGPWPKAVVVLIPGGDLNVGFLPSGTIGVPAPTGGGNFLVRTAQLFADAGYLTVAINKPSDQPPVGSTDTVSDADQYRISMDHAVDILRVLKHINTENLPVYIAGTSLGTLSAVALNQIATGISLSSPAVETDAVSGHLYIGDGTPNLEPSFVQRPVQVLENNLDLCPVVGVTTNPATDGPQLLYNSLTPYTSASYDYVNGGLEVTGSPTDPNNPHYLDSKDIGVCQGFDYHGYFGIETAAVSKITAWLDGEVTGHHALEAPFKTVSTPSSAHHRHIDLANVTENQAGLTYGLYGVSPATSSFTTSLGGSVSINGSTVTYTLPTGVSNETDYFVYYITDGSGNVGAGVITIKIGN